MNIILIIYGVFIYNIRNTYLYLYYICLWSYPIFCIQFNYGLNIILNNKKLIIKSISYSSLLLCLMDKYAIDNFIWNINNNYIITDFTDYITTIPIEEIIFFIVSSSMCIIGLTLFISIKM